MIKPRYNQKLTKNDVKHYCTDTGIVIHPYLALHYSQVPGRPWTPSLVYRHCLSQSVDVMFQNALPLLLNVLFTVQHLPRQCPTSFFIVRHRKCSFCSTATFHVTFFCRTKRFLATTQPLPPPLDSMPQPIVVIRCHSDHATASTAVMDHVGRHDGAKWELTLRPGVVTPAAFTSIGINWRPFASVIDAQLRIRLTTTTATSTSRRTRRILICF